jgi:hypothetical protein
MIYLENFANNNNIVLIEFPDYIDKYMNNP